MDRYDEFEDLLPRKHSKSILLVMKKDLGLEAMLEYMDQYLKTIDKHNPKLKFAVEKALSYMSVEKMYKDAMKREQKYWFNFFGYDWFDEYGI